MQCNIYINFFLCIIQEKETTKLYCCPECIDYIQQLIINVFDVVYQFIKIMCKFYITNIADKYILCSLHVAKVIMITFVILLA